MKFLQIDKSEKATVLLREGTDFHKKDLEPMGNYLILGETKGEVIAHKFGYDALYWSDLYNSKNHTLKVIFVKTLSCSRKKAIRKTRKYRR